MKKLVKVILLEHFVVDVLLSVPINTDLLSIIINSTLKLTKADKNNNNILIGLDDLEKLDLGWCGIDSYEDQLYGCIEIAEFENGTQFKIIPKQPVMRSTTKYINKSKVTKKNTSVKVKVKSTNNKDSKKRKDNKIDKKSKRRKNGSELVLESENKSDSLASVDNNSPTTETENIGIRRLLRLL